METPTYRLEKVVASRDALEDFEGPLDIILQLLSKNKIEIRDIRISLLVEQYTAYLEDMKRMDLEVASEFIAMASHLVYLKTRMLLRASTEQPDEELDALMQALEERRRQDDYNRILTGRDFLESRADIGRSLFTKRPEELPRDKTYAHVHDVSMLSAALFDLRRKAEAALPPTAAAFSAIVGREPFPVGDKIALIVRRLKTAGRLLLTALLKGSGSRSERVATFLAVLELARGRRIEIDDEPDDYVLSMSPEE